MLGLLLAGVAATPAHANSVRSDQWHLDAMKANEIWKISTGEGVTVAVIDSGVDDTLPDLRGQVLAGGKDFSELAGDENNDIADHGTGIAAKIAGTGARGAQTGSFGLAPGVKILPIRMPYASKESVGLESTDTFIRDMSEAIRFAADSPAHIINVSMGQQKADSPELGRAVTYALGKNKLIFAAVGNSGHQGNAVEYPAATPGVIGVGGVDRQGQHWSRSQTGPQVDFVAPAVKVLAACGPTKLCDGDGTSNATALASASAALVWSKNPGWTNNQVLRVLLNTAGKAKSGDARTDLVGYGSVRPLRALTAPGDPGPADEYPLPDAPGTSGAGASKAPSAVATTAAPGAEGEARAVAEKRGDEGGAGVWIALGVGAAVLVGAGATIAVVRGKRV
ncbi:type VII secretion-associated serine protease mycosin [Streptomyces sp. NPDC057638]|uniref:type VII secretion-associated serine protease mycosin n=1 Tax=Streptomyces sp. NPDC057638 TaxID=3346190 RepID=UPI00367904A6